MVVSVCLLLALTTPNNLNNNDNLNNDNNNDNMPATLSQVAARIPDTLQNYIGGQSVAGQGPIYQVPNPATGKVLTKYAISTADDVQDAMTAAAKGQAQWAALPPKQRARLLLHAADLLRQRNDEYAELEAIDTGRPLQETNCVDIVCAYECLEYMASLCATVATAGQHLLCQGATPGASFGYTRREPLGVTAGIGAWNYPLQSAIWKAAPSLAAGNSMVFKPADNTPVTALILAQVFTEVRIVVLLLCMLWYCCCVCYCCCGIVYATVAAALCILRLLRHCVGCYCNNVVVQ